MEGEGRGAAGISRVIGGARAVHWCCVGFVALLAVASTLFYGGAIGRWNDDYFFLRQFDRGAPQGDLSAAMAVRTWFLDERMHFWRPLYCYGYTPIVTALYEWPSVLHVMAALGHVAVCVGLWRFLRWMGAGRTPAVIAALAFLVYPAHFECSLWVTCAPTGFATGLMLVAMWMQMRWARMCGGDAGGFVRRVVFANGPAALAFVACCLNEQPAFLVVCLPVAAWVAGREKRSKFAVQSSNMGDGGRLDGGERDAIPARSTGCPSKRRANPWHVLLVLMPGVLAGVAVAGYVLIARAKIPPQVGKTTGTVVDPRELLATAWEFVSEVIARHDLKKFASGAWSEGWIALGERPRTAWIVMVLLVVCGIIWAWWGARESDDRGAGLGARVGGEVVDERGVRPRGMVLLGASVFVAAWGPLMFIHYPASPRLAYAPSVGLAMMLAGVLEMVLGRASLRPMRHRVARVVALPLLIAGAVMMIGVQHAYRARWKADERQGEQLRLLLPNPAGVERPVFVALKVLDRPVRTGARVFDGHFLSPVVSEWAAGWWLQEHYRREDLVMVQGTGRWAVGRGAEPMIGWLENAAGAVRVQTAQRNVPPFKPRKRRFDVGEIVPFEITVDGEVVMYTHISFENGNAADGPILPPEKEPMMLPMVAEAYGSGRVGKKVLMVPKIVERGGDQMGK